MLLLLFKETNNSRSVFHSSQGTEKFQKTNQSHGFIHELFLLKSLPRQDQHGW